MKNILRYIYVNFKISYYIKVCPANSYIKFGQKRRQYIETMFQKV
jgi:hypothetical protein